MKKNLLLAALAVSFVTTTTLCAHDAQGALTVGTAKAVPYKKSVHNLNPLLPAETAGVRVGFWESVRTGARWQVTCQNNQRTITSAEYYFDKETPSNADKVGKVVGGLRDGAVAFAAPYTAVKLPGALRDRERDVCPPNLPVAPVAPPVKQP
jgi:hypothetical protein